MQYQQCVRVSHTCSLIFLKYRTIENIKFMYIIQSVDVGKGGVLREIMNRNQLGVCMARM